MTILHTEMCCSCKMVFAMPEWYHLAKKHDNTSFFCPAGHSQYYIKDKSDLQKAQEELSRLRQRNAMLCDDVSEERNRREAAERREAAQKANVTKLKKRSGSGVCPCCNRTFLALQKHMQDKHPEFATDDGQKVVPLRHKA